MSDGNRTPTAVSGVLAGHHTDEDHRTGVTVLLFPSGARAGVHVPGSATGTRELGVFSTGSLAGAVHALVLSGGSAFGLASADGVMGVLAEKGIGFDTPFGKVPIVPAAILYDLHTASARPDAAMGRAAALAASHDPLAEGAVGAGTGAQVAGITGTPRPGGVGCWAEEGAPGLVAAVVAVNALGAVRDPDTGGWIVGGPIEGAPSPGLARGQTTLAAVVVEAPLDRDGCTVVAKMAAAGLARTLYPAFSPFDGDVVFVASTGQGPPVGAAEQLQLGDRAATCVAQSVVRGVRGPAARGGRGQPGPGRAPQ